MSIKKGRDVLYIKSRVGELRESLMNSEKFEEIEKANDVIYSLTYRLMTLEKKLPFQQKALRAHGISEKEIGILEKKAAPLTLKEIGNTLKDIRDKCLNEETSKVDLIKVEYQETFKSILGIKKRIHKQREQYTKLAVVSYEDIADLIMKPVDTISSEIHRAKEKIGEMIYGKKKRK
jgi:hypothetical protein